jgi:predicted dehydrogenase
VATRNERSARQAAEAFGADHWFSDPFAMICGDHVDVVTIAVKVPAHREVGAAINVGEVYTHLVRDVHVGTRSTPGFEHAVHNARLIEAITRAAGLGERQKVTGQEP